ncbi:hypothetical protein EV122DRAFT_227257, partial [Schizophyllum commune]
ALPEQTSDITPTQIFSPPIRLEEGAMAKKRAKEHARSSAVGYDRQSCVTFLEVPNEALQELANRCFDSYRLVGLDSCRILKMFTLIIERCAVAWIEDNALIPDTQNDSRARRHGLNNPFVLRRTIDRSMAEGKPLHVVFPDLTNAFPFMVHELLWMCLYAGMRGSLFDWMCMLYRRMHYIVCSNGERGDRLLASDVGFLAGDSFSPRALQLLHWESDAPGSPW